jgi:cell division protein FtsQ
VVLVALGVGVVYSPLLSVRHVEVVGNVHTSRGQVLAAAGLAGPPGSVRMLDAGSTRGLRAVDALPWVASVSFGRRWPWTVVVTVKERSPVALVAAGRGEAVVDVTGRVLEVGPAPADVPPLPVVTGLEATVPGGQASATSGERAGALDGLLEAAALAPRWLAVRGVDLSEDADLGIVARVRQTDALVVLGSTEDLSAKWAVLGELASRVDLAEYSEVDLSVPERPALTPSGISATG